MVKSCHPYGTTAVEGFGCVMLNIEVGERSTARIGGETGKAGRLLLATLIKVLAFCVIKIMAFWLIAFSREVRGSNVAK
jgi:hypothetical protein